MHLDSLPYEFSTERLKVRCWDPADAGALFAAVEESRASVVAHLPTLERIASAAAASSFVRSSRGRFDLMNDFQYGLYLRDGGALVGGIACHPLDPAIGRVAVEFWTHVRERRKGLMREALGATTEMLFRDAGARRVEALVEVNNEPSRALLHQLRFQREGIMQKVMKIGGKYRDMALYAMTRDTP